MIIKNIDVPRYLEYLGEDTIEILYIPGRVGFVGHLGLRVGKDFFHVRRGRGVIKESFNDVLTDRYEKNMVLGYVLKVSPREVKKLENYFKLLISKPQKAYSLFFNNCAHNICRALSEAHISNIPKFNEMDPLFTSMFIEKNRRVVMRTLYNPDADISSSVLMGGVTVNRMVFYGGSSIGAVIVIHQIIETLREEGEASSEKN